MILIKPFSVLVLGMVLLSSAHAGQAFYRCVVNGKSTYTDKYTDKPCDVPPVPDAQGVPRSGGSRSVAAFELDYSTPYGSWRGQAQYQANVNGVIDPAAHVVVPLVIMVERQGKVQGGSPDNGCKFLGVAAPHVAPNLLSLDVTLSQCRYSNLNRRYLGLLALDKSNNLVQLSLRSHNQIISSLLNGPAHFDIKATMKR